MYTGFGSVASDESSSGYRAPKGTLYWQGGDLFGLGAAALSVSQATSYGYDDCARYREMKPGSARLADMRWLYDSSSGSGYDPTQTVELANHGEDGQNVLYWDGHVSFADTVYASENPEDNIYKIDGDNAGRDADAIIVRTHYDGIEPGKEGNKTFL